MTTNSLKDTVMYWADEYHKKVCKICTPFIVGNTIHPSLIKIYRVFYLRWNFFENFEKDSQIF